MDPLTMQDVRLIAGEGTLEPHTVLAACNVLMQQRFEEMRSALRPLAEATLGVNGELVGPTIGDLMAAHYAYYGVDG